MSSRLRSRRGSFQEISTLCGNHFDSQCEIDVLDVNWQLAESHQSKSVGEICNSEHNLAIALGDSAKQALLNGGVNVNVISPGQQNWLATVLVHRHPVMNAVRPAIGFMAQRSDLPVSRTHDHDVPNVRAKRSFCV